MLSRSWQGGKTPYSFKNKITNMSRIGPPATPELLLSPQRPREAGPEDFTRDSRHPMGRMLISAVSLNPGLGGWGGEYEDRGESEGWMDGWVDGWLDG